MAPVPLTQTTFRGGQLLAKHEQRRPSVLAKYLAFELPGWAVAALVLSLLVYTDQLSRGVAALLLGLWVLKDLALFPLLRIAYEPGPVDGSESLVGALGVAQEELSGRSYVRMGPELWRSELAHPAERVPAGATVRVLEVRGLTLIVEAAEVSETPGDGAAVRSAGAPRGSPPRRAS